MNKQRQRAQVRVNKGSMHNDVMDQSGRFEEGMIEDNHKEILSRKPRCTAQSTAFALYCDLLLCNEN